MNDDSRSRVACEMNQSVSKESRCSLDLSREGPTRGCVLESRTLHQFLRRCRSHREYSRKSEMTKTAHRSRVPQRVSRDVARTFYSRSVEFFVTATPRSIFAQPGTTSLDLPRPYANAATYAAAMMGSRVLALANAEPLESAVRDRRLVNVIRPCSFAACDRHLVG